MTLKIYKIIFFSISSLLFLTVVGLHIFILSSGTTKALDQYLISWPILFLFFAFAIIFYNELEIRKQRKIDSKLFWPFSNSPLILRTVLIFMFLYTFISIAFRLSNFGGYANFENGEYTIKVHGVVQQVISRTQYLKYNKEKELAEMLTLSAAFSSIYLLLMVLFYPKNKTLSTTGAKIHTKPTLP